MFQVLSVMLPVVLIVLLGLVAVRAAVMSEATIHALAGFVLNIALPAVILSAFIGQDFAQGFDAGYVAAYAGGSLVAFGGAFAVLRFTRRRSVAHSAMGAMGASASNTGFIGYPLASLALGAPAVVALPMTMMVENILIIPLALFLAELGANGGARSTRGLLRETVLRLARTPLMLAIVAGIALSMSGLHMPDTLTTTIGILAGASAPCALLVVGGTIAGLKRDAVSSDILVIVAVKLLLHPLAVWAAFLLVPGTPPTLVSAGIIFASVSMVTIYPLLCARFGLGKEGATTLIVATALGLLTTSVVIGLFGPASQPALPMP
jgi:predicted permease